MATGIEPELAIYNVAQVKPTAFRSGRASATTPTRHREIMYKRNQILLPSYLGYLHPGCKSQVPRRLQFILRGS